MRKQVFGRRLKRDANERKALFKGLMSELVIHGQIKTTEAKAKAIKASADKLITKARKQEMLARRLLSTELFPPAIDKLLIDVAPRFANRNGGYTRIVRLGRRLSDNASTVIMEWVEGPKTPVAADKPVKQITPKQVERKESTGATPKKSRAKKKEIK